MNGRTAPASGLLPATPAGDRDGGRDGGRDRERDVHRDGDRDSGTGMRAGDRPILPLWLRGGVLALVLCAVAVALATGPVGRSGGGTLAQHARAVETASRELRFLDLDDGGVSVVDATDGAEVRRVVRGEDGFMRSVMRGLANERKARGIGADTPFRVSLLADGSLWLEDPATGREVVLSAFGPDNVAAFARLLPGAPGTAGATVRPSAGSDATAGRGPHDS